MPVFADRTAVPLSTLTRIPQTLRNLQRVQQILHVIAKHGFGDVIYRLNVQSYLSSAATFLKFQRLGRAATIYTLEERLRMAFEELGSTFVKFGQILATRPDLIPMPLVLELRKLQDKVPPFSFEEARAQVERELRCRIDERFAHFSATPLAAGSIGQVHDARLRDGQHVVVKVQRPNLDRALTTDLDILTWLAGLLEENIPEVKAYSPTGVVEEFARSIRKEIDFTREAYHVRRFRKNFESDPRIHVLKTYDDLSTERVLTMEFIEGIKISDLATLDREGCDRKALARLGVEFVLKQIFADGFFHGDPHPGNLFILRKRVGEPSTDAAAPPAAMTSVIAPIDYGMMGILDESRRHDLLLLFLGIVSRDMDSIVKLFARLDLLSRNVNVHALKADGADLIDRYYGLELQRVDMGKFFSQLFEMLNRHHVKIPPDILLMGKSLATIDGIARMLDPELDLVAAIRPFILREYLKHLMDVRRMSHEVWATAEDYLKFLRYVPAELQQTVTRLRKGELEVPLQIERLEEVVMETNRSANRVATGLIVTAVTMASAMLFSGSGAGPVVWGLPLTHILGSGAMVLAGVLAVTLFFAILRSGGVGGA
ncbi:MAG: AarF/ABC1/UbiB kinase family protein [Planctomycetes bacterium]|nr:AarF/ABC1/UbiB kinase family protein [Planctomycetota bacterium]